MEGDADASEEAPGLCRAGPGDGAAVAVMEQCQDWGFSPRQRQSHSSVPDPEIATPRGMCLTRGLRQDGLMELITHSFSLESPVRL